MYRTLTALGCCLALAPFCRGQEYYQIPGSLPIPRPSHNVTDWGPLDYDDTPGAVPGGIVFGRVNGQRVLRIGGALFPMRVRVTEPGPDGPVTTRMVLPSSGQSPLVPLALQHQSVPPGATLHFGASAAPAVPAVPAVTCGMRVQMPDPIGLLYVDGRLTDSRGESRVVPSPAPGKTQVVRLRAAFKVGDNLLIEEKEVVVRAGEIAEVKFDGARAMSVPLPQSQSAVVSQSAVAIPPARK